MSQHNRHGLAWSARAGCCDVAASASRTSIQQSRQVRQSNKVAKVRQSNKVANVRQSNKPTMHGNPTNRQRAAIQQADKPPTNPALGPSKKASPGAGCSRLSQQSRRYMCNKPTIRPTSQQCVQQADTRGGCRASSVTSGGWSCHKLGGMELSQARGGWSCHKQGGWSCHKLGGVELSQALGASQAPAAWQEGLLTLRGCDLFFGWHVH